MQKQMQDALKKKLRQKLGPAKKPDSKAKEKE